MSDSPARKYRRPGIDLARGLAVLAMVAYHFSWDLGYFRFIDGFPATSPLGRFSAQIIANSFLALVGVSLTLSSQSKDAVPKFWRRQALLGAAAAALSLATYLFMPESWIFFGILHCIFVCSLIGFALRKARTEILLAVALAAILLPIFIASTTFDSPWLVWLGLGRAAPMTNDFAPLLPHLATVLAGMVFARLRLLQPEFANDNIRPAPKSWLTRFLLFCGRHSLAIYLIHQPVLFGAMLGLSSLVHTPEAMFESDCQNQCAVSGGSARICQTACTCLTGELKAANLWTPLMNDGLDDAGHSQMSVFALACGQKARAQ